MRNYYKIGKYEAKLVSTTLNCKKTIEIAFFYAMREHFSAPFQIVCHLRRDAFPVGLTFHQTDSRLPMYLGTKTNGQIVL